MFDMSYTCKLDGLKIGDATTHAQWHITHGELEVPDVTCPEDGSRLAPASLIVDQYGHAGSFECGKHWYDPDGYTEPDWMRRDRERQERTRQEYGL